MATGSKKAPRTRAPAAKRTRPHAALAPPTTLAVELRGAVALLALRRPEVHNAFNPTLIREMTAALEGLDDEPSVRAVILLGEGRSFCAGADVAWMRESAGYTRSRNLADARALARLLRTLDRLRKPTIARVHGPAYGGGVGLVACCDVVVARQDVTFALSEAKLGLVPATISPYVIEAIGARHARRYFLTGERISAAEAFRLGLVHELVVDDEALDARINEILASLLLAGPAAQAASKDLIRAVAHRPIAPAVIEDTAKRIASVRASAEAKEGLGAFLEKRSAAWVPDALKK